MPNHDLSSHWNVSRDNVGLETISLASFIVEKKEMPTKTCSDTIQILFDLIFNSILAITFLFERLKHRIVSKTNVASYVNVQ